MPSRQTGPLLNAELSRGNREWMSNMPICPGPDYSVYFNDFMNTADYAAADWTITTTEAGAGDATEAIAADERFGALVITNDAADNDNDSLQLNEETFKLEAGERLWYEIRVKVSDADQCDMFVGLNITDTTPLDTSDRIGFQVDDGSAAILCKSEKDGTESSTASGQSLADNTYVKLGFYWDGINKVKFFVNRALVATHTSNIPDDENLAITLFLQNGEAVAKVMTVDYIWCMAERV